MDISSFDRAALGLKMTRFAQWLAESRAANELADYRGRMQLNNEPRIAPPFDLAA